MSTAGLVKKTSKALHKWIGLFGFFWLAVMGATGIILNHPALISSIDLPRNLLPGDYEYRDWNRNAFRGALENPEGGLLIYGETGVWRFYGDSVPLSDFSTGLPKAAYLRDVRDLLEVDGTLIAATRGGLFARGTQDASWKGVALSKDYPVDLFQGRDRIFALTRSDLYAAPLYDPLKFTKVTPAKSDLKDPRRSLFRLVFDMHYGETWGSAGRYLMDLAGVYLVFGSLTGAWFWWRKKRKTLSEGRAGKLACKGLKLHIKLGLWFAPLLVFSALTGIFERPPFLVAIADAEYPMSLHPGPRPENPWHDTLRKGLYDPSRETLVLATSEGFYEGREFLLGRESASFHRLPGGAPVSVMGATVFEKDRQSPGSTYLVGSMSGLYRWDRDRREVVNLFTGEVPSAPKGPPVGDHMVVGYSPLDLSGRFLWADYNRGLFLSDGRSAGISPPPGLEDGGRISLWHALFELHNGRFFTFLLGWWNWLVVPLTGLCLIVVTVTGVYDRLKAKR